MRSNPGDGPRIRAGSFRNVVMAMVSWLLVAGSSQAANVTTNASNGYQLLLNGRPFVAKGINYSPVPTGAAPQNAPYGDYFVSSFSSTWKPDIDKIRASGANVIKLYAGNPALNAGAPGTCGNWKPFLDYCYNKGKNPIYVVMFSYTDGGTIAGGGAGLQGFITDYTNMVASTVKHRAVFGYLIGNEIFGGQSSNPTFWTNFGQIVDAAHQAGVAQGQAPFLATATEDDYVSGTGWNPIQYGESSGALTNLNAWMINVYRGPDFGADGNNLVFPEYQTQMEAVGQVKPLLLGEWGTPHTTRSASTYGQNVLAPVRNLDRVPRSQMGQGNTYYDAVPVGDFLSNQWATISANLSAGDDQVCAGGFIFDFSDEYWKGGNANTQTGGPASGFMGGAFAGGYWDEAGFGLSSSASLGSPRTFFKGYAAVTNFYNQSSHSGGELYALGASPRTGPSPSGTKPLRGWVQPKGTWVPTDPSTWYP